jgi:F420-dependent oxidoreductase-like protein
VAGRLAVSVTPGRDLEASIERVRRAEAIGYESGWTTQLPDARDAGVVLAAYANATFRIGLGTFVLPIYTRHPSLMAQMALTIDEVSHGRFTLGIGVSHQVTVEGLWGLKLEHPVVAMREYVDIVRDVVTNGATAREGTQFTARVAYRGPRRAELPIVISALSPRMLELAGEIGDGVALWMCAPGYIRDVVVPHVRAGRERAGKSMDGFDVIAAVPAMLTEDRAAALAVFRATATRYASLPFYRRALDTAFGDRMADEPPDDVLDELAGIGDAARIRETVARYRQAGVTLPVIGADGGYNGWAGFEKTLETLAA